LSLLLISLKCFLKINLDDKASVYGTVKFDFKEDLLNKFIVHSQFLFSDLTLASRNYLVTFSDRFLTKFSIPENEMKKNVSIEFFFKQIIDTLVLEQKILLFCKIFQICFLKSPILLIKIFRVRVVYS
jgi:hypothetical protein